MDNYTDELALHLLEKARRAADHSLPALESLEAALQAMEAGDAFADAVVQKWIEKVFPASQRGTALAALACRVAQKPLGPVGRVYGLGLAAAAHVVDLNKIA